MKPSAGFPALPPAHREPLPLFDSADAPRQAAAPPPSTAPGSTPKPTGQVFDADAGELLKAQGMARAAVNRAGLVDLARQIAVKVALSRPSREFTADDIQEGIIAAGYSDRALGPAAGAVFLDKRFESTGRLEPSRRACNHRHCNRVWRLREEVTA